MKREERREKREERREKREERERERGKETDIEKEIGGQGINSDVADRVGLCVVFLLLFRRTSDDGVMSESHASLPGLRYSYCSLTRRARRLGSECQWSRATPDPVRSVQLRVGVFAWATLDLTRCSRVGLGVFAQVQAGCDQMHAG